MQTSTPSRILHTALALAATASGAAAQSLLSQHGETVLAAGDAAPGLVGVQIQPGSSGALDSPVMDQNGTLVFRARLVGAVTGADDRALFVGNGAGDLQLAVRAGDQAPGQPAGTLLRSSSATAGSGGLESDPVISPFGEILYFGSRLYDPVTPANTPTSSDSAFFWGPIGSLLPLAREGEQVPFLPAGVLYGSLSFSRQFHGINASGQVILQCGLTGAATASDNAVMATGLPGSLQVIMREGDTLPTGEVIIPASGSTMSFKSQINEAGQVLHDMRFSTTTGTANIANDRALAIWAAGAGSTIVVREGDPAPGLPAGTLLQRNGSTTWTVDAGANNFTKSGNTAFIVYVDQGGTTPGVDDRVIYFGGIGGVAPIVRRGDATGLAGGETFDVFNNSSLTCNDLATVAFVSSLAGPSVTTANDSSLWVGTAGSWTLLGREGDPMPIVPASANGPWTIRSIAGGTNSPRLNDAGQVLYQLGGNDGVDNEDFVFVYDPVLGTRLLIDGGDMLTTSAGTGQITFFGNAGTFNSGDGSTYWFNNAGDVVIEAGIDGGLGSAIVRCHAGGLIGTPASVPVAGGTQAFTVDVGPAFGNQLYAIVGSLSGTRPGTVTPLGPQTIPLNFDQWTTLSLSLANSIVYPMSLFVTDAQGQASSSFTLPPGIAGVPTGILHHALITLDFGLAQTYVSSPVAVRLH